MTVTIREAMLDPHLFGEQFAGDSWAAWRALLAGFYGLNLDDAERETWDMLTGGRSVPESDADELWLAVGRRGGKSQCAALTAVFEASFRDHRDKLAPGEVATVMVLAADRRQARTVMRYARGLVEQNPMLRRMVSRETEESIELTNRSVIEVHTASFRAVRGYTLAAAVADEVSFWRSEESSNPDFEIVSALRPALATLGGKLLAMSSPYAKRGALWDAYRRHYGQDSPGIVVAQAPSRVMNPRLPQRLVDEALARDPQSARAEYLGEFRSDVSTFLDREVVESAKRKAPLENPPDPAQQYIAFVDPSGGGADEFCLSIGHAIRRRSAQPERPASIVSRGVFSGSRRELPREHPEPDEPGRVVVDLVRGRKGSPAEIVREYAQLLGCYGIRTVYGDRYAGQWPADEFRRYGIQYETAAKPKSDLYVDALAAFNSGRVEIPPDDKLVAQMASLERRTSRAGRDSIDHAPGGHDDRANVVAGLVAHSKTRSAGVVSVPIKGLM